MTKILRPVMVALGGPARLAGPQEFEKRHRSRRRTTVGKAHAIERYVRQRQKIIYPDEHSAANRLKKNSLVDLGKIWHNTSLGHIFLADREPEMYEFREHLYAQAADHNRENRHWHVIVELTWTILGDEARSDLMTLVGESLPAEFWA
jgi:hypothetical protein